MITLETLQARQDFAATEARVKQSLARAASSPEALVRFCGNYADWNGLFGSGVAALAAKIGRNHGLFLDADQPLSSIADRSVYVASYFFDAARDEFDDAVNPDRDTHRCLGQAFVSGVVHWTGFSPEKANKLLAPPLWLRTLQDRVAEGYGAHSPDTRTAIFEAMGYHLGSEILADQEFSLIDHTLRHDVSEVAGYLGNHSVEINGSHHNAWHWIKVHSGHGGGVEHDHFEWAVKGVRRGLDYTPEAERGAAVEAVLRGFDRFADDHAVFFSDHSG